MNRAIDLMVTGDLHLGIHPTKIPEEDDAEHFSPGHIWHNTVEEAIQRNVDGLILTGDIVDRANQFYEAWGPFESGLHSLSAHDIPVFMVAGNHDADVLNDFVESMDVDAATLIGAGGAWQRVPVEVDGSVLFQLDGWSYPTRHVRQNPMEEYDLPEPDRPTFGMLHTTLNRPGSSYAPVSDEDLRRAPIDGWLLGHIHKPQIISEDPLILNPGSPQPLNPTERGVHGPWIVSLDPSGIIEAEQLPLATLRYVELDLDVSELETPENLPGLLKRTLEEHLDGAIDGADHTKLLALRGTLMGTTPWFHRLEEERRSLLESLQFSVGECAVAIERLTNRMRRRADLEELMEGSGPVARLAQLLRQLEGNGEEEPPRELLQNAQEAMQSAFQANTYEPLRTHNEAPSPSPDDARRILTKQGWDLLEALLDQKENGP